jgi:hypothetical protein
MALATAAALATEASCRQIGLADDILQNYVVAE